MDVAPVIFLSTRPLALATRTVVSNRGMYIPKEKVTKVRTPSRKLPKVRAYSIIDMNIGVEQDRDATAYVTP